MPIRLQGIRFSLKHLFVLTATVAIVLGIWVNWFRKGVQIEEASSEHAESRRYLGFDVGDLGFDVGEMQTRNILVASGNFSNNTVLCASVYLIQSRTITEGNTLGAGRSSGQLSVFPVSKLTITLALGEVTGAHGQIVRLGCAGHRAGWCSRGELEHDIEISARKTFLGWVPPGKTRIVYVEGDSAPVVTADMTLDEFAAKNSGNYVVVTVEVRK